MKSRLQIHWKCKENVLRVIVVASDNNLEKINKYEY